MSKLTVLLYAVNGAGVGHLVRLLAIARWIRRYAALLDASAEIHFLTSSEASSLAFREGFASWKLPSKTVIRDAKISKPSYLRAARQWVFSSVALLRPDLLIVDSFPNGSFNELLQVLDLVPKKAFVYRAAKKDFAARASFQALLPLYDRILVPHDPGEVDVVIPPSARSRVVWTGPVLSREREELLPRDEARARLGVEERLAVYASAGGGGDPGAERSLEAILEAARERPDVHVVVGAGPLYRGAERHGPRVTWLSRGDAPDLMAGFDLAISAGGYNAVHELLHHGVPVAFFSQPKIADAQRSRVARAAAAGAALDLGRAPSREQLRASLDRLSDETVRRNMSERARSLVPENHARDAALEALALALDRRDLEEARAVASGGLLPAVRESGAPFDFAAGIAGSLARGHRSDDRARERRTIERFLERSRTELDGSLAPVRAALERSFGSGDEDFARDLARATALVLERARALGLALEANLALLVRAVARRAKGALARPSEVAKAACALLEAAAEHGVAAARALMEVLPQEDGEVSALKLELALRAVAVSARGRKDGLVLARQAALAAADEDPGAGATVVLERASEALSLPGKEGEPA